MNKQIQESQKKLEKLFEQIEEDTAKEAQLDEFGELINVPTLIEEFV